jgi:hypothetical protein
MMTVNKIIELVGANYIEASCDVSVYALRSAKREKTFPSSWYGLIKAECDRLGIDCPMDLFSFKKPLHSYKGDEV